MKAVVFSQFAVLSNSLQQHPTPTAFLEGQKERPSVFVDGFLPLFADEQNLVSVNLPMKDIYGPPLCGGSEGFVKDAPSNYCRHMNNQEAFSIDKACHPEIAFDQFALERILLGKWASSSWVCNNVSTTCAETADVIVVPSLTLQVLTLDGFNWKTIDPDANDPTGCTGATGRLKELQTRQKLNRDFWNLLREKYYKPDKMPLIVMHFAFTWDIQNSVEVLHALAEQPADFVNRVIFASIESNVRNAERELFGKSWSDGTEAQLKNRALQQSDGAGPLMVTMPYPTSILEPVEFNLKAERRISVSMSVDVKRGGPGIRNNMTKQLWENGGSYGMICNPQAGTKGQDHCGLGSSPNFWEVVASSTFCLEPSGDTLTRSHFYLAVQSGCIPVVFDGGDPAKYQPSNPTWWAWRSSGSEKHEPFVKYDDFAVVYNSNDVAAGRVEVVKDLLEMPSKDPERFQRLRKNLNSVAAHMIYSKDQCEIGGSCSDAFTNLQSVVQLALELY